MNRIAVIVGRFQVPFFTDDHRATIDNISEQYDELVFIVGLSFCPASLEDPLNFHTRKRMIINQFGSVRVLYIKDEHNDDNWSERLDHLLNSEIKCSDTGNVDVFGSQENFIDRYTGVFPTIPMERISIHNIDSIKPLLANTDGCQDIDEAYRRGAFHVATNTFDNPMPVVDMAVVDEKNLRILLGRKKGQTLYRFFGGFAENTIRTYELDALREVEEEASLFAQDPNGNVLLDHPEYITSALIDDWRYRGVSRKIKTILFYIRYHGGLPRANDDIEVVQWFDLKELSTTYRNIMVRSHVQLMDILMCKLREKGLV